MRRPKNRNAAAVKFECGGERVVRERERGWREGEVAVSRGTPAAICRRWTV